MLSILLTFAEISAMIYSHKLYSSKEKGVYPKMGNRDVSPQHNTEIFSHPDKDVELKTQKY